MEAGVQVYRCEDSKMGITCPTFLLDFSALGLLRDGRRKHCHEMHCIGCGVHQPAHIAYNPA